MGWFREWLRGEDPAAVSAAGPARVSSAGSPSRGGRPGGSGDGAGREAGYPGERLGLPEHGPGSVATLARRGLQFLADALLAGLLTALFTLPRAPQNWSLITWAVLMTVPVALFGSTPAMTMLGMRVVRLARPEAPGIGPVWALVRTVSVFFVIPALLVDRDSRGAQDRATGTVVLRTR